MVPKPGTMVVVAKASFRAVLFRMVPKHCSPKNRNPERFRAVLFRMVPKLKGGIRD